MFYLQQDFFSMHWNGILQMNHNDYSIWVPSLQDTEISISFFKKLQKE